MTMIFTNAGDTTESFASRHGDFNLELHYAVAQARLDQNADRVMDDDPSQVEAFMRMKRLPVTGTRDDGRAVTDSTAAIHLDCEHGGYSEAIKGGPNHDDWDEVMKSLMMQFSAWAPCFPNCKFMSQYNLPAFNKWDHSADDRRMWSDNQSIAMNELRAFGLTAGVTVAYRIGPQWKDYWLVGLDEAKKTCDAVGLPLVVHWSHRYAPDYLGCAPSSELIPEDEIRWQARVTHERGLSSSWWTASEYYCRWAFERAGGSWLLNGDKWGRTRSSLTTELSHHGLDPNDYVHEPGGWDTLDPVAYGRLLRHLEDRQIDSYDWINDEIGNPSPQDEWTPVSTGDLEAVQALGARSSEAAAEASEAAQRAAVIADTLRVAQGALTL